LAHGYDRRPETRTILFLFPHTAVNTYVRPGRTFTVVDVEREALGMADTDNTRRPVQTERSKRWPRTRLPAVLPSIRRLRTKFRPRSDPLQTMRRPRDWAAAVPIETA